MQSNVQEDAGLVRENLLLNAKNGSVHLVVNVRQVTGGGALSHAAEFIVHGTVAEADPALVGAQVRHGNAAQVSADSRAAEDGRVSGGGNGGLGGLINESGVGKGVSEIDLTLSQTTDEDHLTVPGSLGDLTWGQLRDIKLLVGVTDVTITANGLVVNHGDESLDAEDVIAENETLEHVDLRTSNFVITVLLVPRSVLIEPVVGLGLNVKRIAEVGGTGRGDPEHLAIGLEQVIGKLLVLSVVVILHNTEVTLSSSKV